MSQDTCRPEQVVGSSCVILGLHWFLMERVMKGDDLSASLLPPPSTAEKPKKVAMGFVEG